MEPNSKRFVDRFVEIEMFLKDYLDMPGVGFVQMVHMAAKTHPIVRRYVNTLIEYSQLRNAIVHTRIDGDVAIAEPHDDVCDTLAHILTLLQSPKPLRTVLKAEKVYCADVNDPIQTILREQGQRDYSVVPVYDKGHYVGVIHPKSYQMFLEKHLSLKSTQPVIARDFLPYMGNKERVVFQAVATPIDQIVDLFVTKHEHGAALIAILITHNGAQDEPLMGILTPADLPRLLAVLE